MNKTQKTLIVTAAIAGLVGGAMVNANAKSGSSQSQTSNLAGKQVPGAWASLNGCNGCPAPKTNKVTIH